MGKDRGAAFQRRKEVVRREILEALPPEAKDVQLRVTSFNPDRRRISVQLGCQEFLGRQVVASTITAETAAQVADMLTGVLGLTT